jgi:hypothetical protein
MTVSIEIRDVSLSPKPTTGIGSQVATVTFSIKSDPEPNLDIAFMIPTDHGLDAAINGDAKALLELFAAELGAAAKNFTFP